MDVLSCIHESHFGTDSHRRRARELLFWSGISKEIIIVIIIRNEQNERVYFEHITNKTTVV